MLGKYATRLLSESVKILLNALRIFCKLKRENFHLSVLSLLSVFFSLSRSGTILRVLSDGRVVNEWKQSSHSYTHEVHKKYPWGMKGKYSRGEKLVQWKINQNIFMKWIFKMRPLAGENCKHLHLKNYFKVSPLCQIQKQQIFPFKGSSEVDKIEGWFLRHFMKWNYRTGWITERCPSNNVRCMCIIMCVILGVDNEYA